MTRPDLRGATVLVVDDDDAMRFALRSLLDRAGCQVVEAASIADAQTVIREREGGFEAAIIDLMLPDGLGGALIRELRLHPHPCAAIVLTGADTAVAAQVAIIEGAQTLVFKPAPSNELMEAVHEAIARTAEYQRWRGVTPGASSEAAAVSVAELDTGPFDAVLPAVGDDLLQLAVRVLVDAGKLTPSQTRILQPLLLGQEYREIADALNISVETVRTHVKAILAKLGMSSTRALFRVFLTELETRAAPSSGSA